jgi:hypothetical protein
MLSTLTKFNFIANVEEFYVAVLLPLARWCKFFCTSSLSTLMFFLQDCNHKIMIFLTASCAGGGLLSRMVHLKRRFLRRLESISWRSKARWRREYEAWWVRREFAVPKFDAACIGTEKNCVRTCSPFIPVTSYEANYTQVLIWRRLEIIVFLVWLSGFGRVSLLRHLKFFRINPWTRRSRLY